MIPTLKPKIRSYIALFSVCITTATAPLIAAENTQVTVAGAGGARLRVEAIDPSIVRLWLKPAGEFIRAQSLAMESAPSSRVPLAVSKSDSVIRLRTDALSISIDRRTLAFEVCSAKGGQVLVPETALNTSTDAPAWRLTRRLADGERILGLGQDNHNNGRLDRRGVIGNCGRASKLTRGMSRLSIRCRSFSACSPTVRLTVCFSTTRIGCVLISAQRSPTNSASTPPEARLIFMSSPVRTLPT